MKLYESENEIETYLRNGTSEERINALCSIDPKKETYNRFWEIFISDIDLRVKGNALCGAIHSNPNNIWDIAEYIIKNEIHQEQFLRIVIIHLLEIHKKNKKVI